MSGVTIERLTLADEAADWAALGFEVDGDRCRVGAVELRFAGRDAGRGIVGWTLRGIASTELDGLPTIRAEEDPERGASAATGGAIGADRGADAAGRGADDARRGAGAEPHPNGVTRIDHVVAISPRLDRTVRALQSAGLELRRIRERPTPAGAPRQAFFRLGPELLEAIQEPREVLDRSGGPDRPAFFWGLALRCADLDATVAGLGDAVGEIRDAVQPGRRIASVRRVAGLALPVALMTG